jgi:hypothetical protein
MLRWGTRMAVVAAVALPIAALAGALFWPDAMKANGEGGFFGWGAFAGLYEMLLCAGLAARWAAKRSRSGLKRLGAAFGAAMGIVGLFIVLQALLLLVDPRDHHGIYAIYLLIGVSLEVLLLQGLVYAGVLHLVARGFRRWRERTA